MSVLKLKDEPFDLGPITVRMNSIEHLRFNNLFKNFDAKQLLPVLEPYGGEKHGIVKLAIERLNENLPTQTDGKLVIKLIYHGQMYGLSASPQPPILANLLWQTTAIVLKQNSVEHPNEFINSD